MIFSFIYLQQKKRKEKVLSVGICCVSMSSEEIRNLKKNRYRSNECNKQKNK